MAIIPMNPNTTLSKINEGFSTSANNFNFDIKRSVSHTRNYMGLSGIGEKCIRKLQYTFRMASNNDTNFRTQRIFDLGNIIEQLIIWELERIGISVKNQQKGITGAFGHWKGHIDGTALGIIEAPRTEHLLECKSHKDKLFKKLVDDGVRESNPKYYSQMQIYMDGLRLKRGLYVGYNKDNSELYFERVYPDKDHVQELKEKQQVVIMEELPAHRIGSGKISWYECKFCKHKDVCFNQIVPLKNCGTCEYRDVYDNGVFKCSKKNDYALSWSEMRNGCFFYKISEFFRS